MKKLDSYIEFYYNTNTKFLTINEFIAHLDRENAIKDNESKCGTSETKQYSFCQKWFTNVPF